MRPPTVALFQLLAATAVFPACAPVETQTTLATPSTKAAQTAGIGDTVMDFRSRRSLPNAFGKADLFGRTTNAGRTTVRYVGTSGAQAIFERIDVVIDSNATTMSETPMIVPSTTNTRVSGSVGGMAVTGNATSTSYRYIPPRGSTEYATTANPIRFGLGAGESVAIEGKSLRVVRVAPASVEYRID